LVPPVTTATLPSSLMRVSLPRWVVCSRRGEGSSHSLCDESSSP
jgi:hypothetical protein